MAPQRSPTVELLDPDVMDAMTASNGSLTLSPPPCAQLGKRKASDDPDGTGNDADISELAEGSAGAELLETPVPDSASQLSQLGQHLAKKNKLRADQLDDVDAFAATALYAEQNMKIFVKLLLVENLLQKIIVAQPKYEVSKYLFDNIKRISLSVLLSPNISQYTGVSAMKPVVERLKRDRFDLPPNIHRNAADWKKVEQCIQYHQTQIRALWKKDIKASIKDDDPRGHSTVYQLARAMASDACKVTVPLCARVALMRNVYVQNMNDLKGYWEKVDKRLAGIRKAAKADKTMIAKGLLHFLQKDRGVHGVENPERDVDDGEQDGFQLEIDDALEN